MEPCDCDDINPLISPFRTEDAGGLDLDCDGLPGVACRLDFDQDGVGVGASYVAPMCPEGSSVANDLGSDCDDADPTVFPGAPEHCDGADSNCDGIGDRGTISMHTTTGIVDLQPLDALTLVADDAHEIAICASGPETPALTIQLGNLADRSIWIHGVEVTSEDQVPLAITGFNYDPDAAIELTIEDVQATTANQQPVLALSIDRDYGQQSDVALRRVQIRGTSNGVLLDPGFAALQLDDVAFLETTSFYGAVSARRHLGADGLQFFDHDGPHLELADGTLTDVTISGGEASGPLIRIEGSATINGASLAIGPNRAASIVEVANGGQVGLTDVTWMGVATTAPLHAAGVAALTSNTFLQTQGGMAGGVWIENTGVVTAIGSSWRETSSAGSGGAIRSAGTVILVDAVITDCRAVTNGGGMAVEGGTTVLLRTTFRGNAADGFGGGVYAVNSRVTLEQESRFEQNVAARGGGVYLLFSQLDGGSGGVFARANEATATTSNHGHGGFLHVAGAADRATFGLLRAEDQPGLGWSVGVLEALGFANSTVGDTTIWSQGASSTTLIANYASTDRTIIHREGSRAEFYGAGGTTTGDYYALCIPGGCLCAGTNLDCWVYP